jgi:hypothetical protein
VRCLSCNYDLSNLIEHRCPECCRAFDVNDPSTFNAGLEPLSRDAKVLGCLGLTLSTWATFAARNILLDVNEKDRFDLLLTAIGALALNLLVVVAIHLVRIRRARR